MSRKKLLHRAIKCNRSQPPTSSRKYPVLEKLKSSKVLSSDGAWGTLLQAKGLKPGECPESWNLTHPEEVQDIAKQYIEAGADMIETNSFGGSRFNRGYIGGHAGTVPFLLPELR